MKPFSTQGLDSRSPETFCYKNECWAARTSLPAGDLVQPLAYQYATALFLPSRPP